MVLLKNARKNNATNKGGITTQSGRGTRSFTFLGDSGIEKVETWSKKLQSSDSQEEVYKYGIM